LAIKNFSVYHTLREGNQATDFMAKLCSSVDHDLVTYLMSPDGINFLLHSDASGVFFF
jgi:hypothetical protein